MKIKKLTALAMTTAMCAATIFGCGGNGDDNQKTTAGNAGTPNEPVKADILVWCPAEDQESGWIQKMCDQFNTAHPEWDITFKYETCSEGDAGKTVTQDPTVAADVYFFANDQLTTLLNANAISKLSGSVEDYVKETNSEQMLSTVTKDGNVYGLPFTANTWFMYYNTDIFTEDDIKSLDTMVAKHKVSFPLTNSWYFASFYAGVDGASFHGKDGSDEATGVVLGDKGVDVTKYLVKLVDNANFVDDTKGSGIAGLGDGSVGAIFSGSWDYNNVKEKLGDKMGIAALPTINVAGSDYSLKSFAGSKAIGVNPHTKNAQIATTLAQYLASEEAQLAHYEMRSVVPCNTKLLESDAVKNDLLAQAQAKTVAETSIIQPNNTKFGNYWDAATTLAGELLNDTVTEANAAEKTTAFQNAANGVK